jgi:hypothetical protein
VLLNDADQPYAGCFGYMDKRTSQAGIRDAEEYLKTDLIKRNKTETVLSCLFLEGL